MFSFLAEMKGKQMRNPMDLQLLGAFSVVGVKIELRRTIQLKGSLANYEGAPKERHCLPKKL